MKNRKMTMSELARLADVDISTVSRALNNSPLVKEETRAQILKIAAETGYAVNASARNLRRQSSETLGLVIPIRPESGQTVADPFYLEMVGAVTHAAAKRGYDLIVSLPTEEEVIAERRLLQTGKADGLIVIGQAGRIERLKTLGELAKKIVVWGGHGEGGNYTVVGSDNVKGGDIATSYLIDKKQRRRILFIGQLTLPEVSLRYDGFVKAHQDRGLSIEPSLLMEIDFGDADAYQRIRDFIAEHGDMDGIFASSDVLAIAALHALRSLGKSVPKDVSVIGYDNIGQASMVRPALTTIDQNIAKGGEMLVELLLRKLADEDVEPYITSTDLVERHSA